MSASGAWGPAPPGVDLNQTQDASVIASVAANIALAVAAVGLRMFARISRYGPGMGIDDHFILLALLLCLGNAVCCLISVPWGGGKHLWVLSLDEFNKLFQTTYAFVIVYISSVSATKVSILLYYRRVFGTSIVYYVVFALAIVHWLEVTTTWLAGCSPISYYWRQYTDPTAVGHCIDAPVFYLVNGAIGMVIDVAILLVPIPTIYQLRMPLRKKMLVCGILLLGSFVCVASIVRIIMIHRLVHAQDISWAMSRVFVWSCVEPSVGIICACLPTYAPLARGWLPTSSDHGPSRRQYYFRESSTGVDSLEKRQYTGPVADDEVELAVRVTSGGQADLPGTSDGGPKANWDTDIMVKKEFIVTSDPCS